MSDNVSEFRKGKWSAEEDHILTTFLTSHQLTGKGGWNSLPRRAGLKRSGKSCRMRWINYLRPDVKRGNFTPDEDDLILRLHRLLGNKWALIAGRIPGRTDNEIKNYWNTYLSKNKRQHQANVSKNTKQFKVNTGSIITGETSLEEKSGQNVESVVRMSREDEEENEDMKSICGYIDDPSLFGLCLEEEELWSMKTSIVGLVSPQWDQQFIELMGNTAHLHDHSDTETCVPDHFLA